MLGTIVGWISFLSTPSARRATNARNVNTDGTLFLSTPSARRATSNANDQRAVTIISIHALREEGDSTVARMLAIGGNFYPRPPRGGRPPTAPSSITVPSISIHALREEGDGSPPAGCSRPRYFYPRPPRGGRRPSGW